MQDQYGSCIIDYAQYKKLMKNRKQISLQKQQQNQPSRTNNNIQKRHIQLQNSSLSPYNRSSSRISLSPSRTSNIFLENRKLIKELGKKDQVIKKYKVMISSIVEAIGKVYSIQAAQQIQQMINLLQKQNKILDTQNNSESDSNGIFSQQRISQLQLSDSVASNRLTMINKQGTFNNIGDTIQQIMRNSHSSYNIKQFFDQIPQKSQINNSNKIETPSIFTLSSDNLALKTPLKEHTNRQIIKNPVSQSIKEESLIICRSCSQVCQQKVQVSCNKQSVSQPITNYKNNKKYDTQKSEDIQYFPLFQQAQHSNNSSNFGQTTQQFHTLFSQLNELKIQIEQQMKMLKISKQKMNRDKQYRKLQRQLQKIQKIIQFKKKQMILVSNSSSVSSLQSSMSNNKYQLQVYNKVQHICKNEQSKGINKQSKGINKQSTGMMKKISKKLKSKACQQNISSTKLNDCFKKQSPSSLKGRISKDNHL